MANNCWFAHISGRTKKTVSFFRAKVIATPSAEVGMNFRLVGQKIVFYFLISVGLRLTIRWDWREVKGIQQFFIVLAFH